MSSVSDRIAQEDQVLREIRLALSAYKSMASTGQTPCRRRGAVYASAPITTGKRLYDEMRRFGFKTVEEFKRHEPDKFKTRIMQSNLREGQVFTEYLHLKGFPLVINPGEYFARGWTQEHYMSLWRQVITRYTRSIAFVAYWQFSTGCVGEFLVGLEAHKRMFGYNISSLKPESADLIREAVDQIDAWGFDPKPLYELWRKITLTLDASKEQKS